MARLETALGRVLFAKTPQGYALTPEGTALIPHAEAAETVKSVDAKEEPAADADAAEKQEKKADDSDI